MYSNNFTNTVKATAYGQWPFILQKLAGLTKKETTPTKRGMPCPYCNGHDRYEFKNPDNGFFLCRGCGAGDGWKMLMQMNVWAFPDAVRAVAELLHIQNGYVTERQQANFNRQADLRQRESEWEAMNIAQRQDRRAAYAFQEWNCAAPADPQNPYLVSHKLPQFNLRQINHRHYGACLLVPLVNEQYQLRNNERILTNGDKRGIKEAQRTGCFYQFGCMSPVVYVAEGWATAAAIHINHPRQPVVLAAMSSTNLSAVVDNATRLFPESRIVIAADHDPDGMKAAVAVAKKYDLKIILPDETGMDFCDAHIQSVRSGCNESSRKYL